MTKIKRPAAVGIARTQNAMRPERVAECGRGGGGTRSEVLGLAGGATSELAERAGSAGFGWLVSLKRVNSCRLASSLRARAAVLSKVKLFGSVWRAGVGVGGV